MSSKNEKPNKDLAVLILAAGSSSRLGQPKQLVKWKGKTLLENTIAAAQAISENVNVVLGANQDKIVSSIEHLDCESLIFNNWKEGMGASLSFGIGEVLKANPSLSQILILVCDQVHVSEDLLIKLSNTHQVSDYSITACRYGGLFGVPAIFSEGTFSELLELTGDRGAKKIIQNNRERVGYIDFPEGDVDVDTVDDLDKLSL